MSSVREIESELLRELALDRPDFAGATLDPSPNFGPRRDGKVPAFLILHYTGLATAEEAVQVLKSPDMEVSAHYLVHEDGRIVQMVSEKARAWHAGKSFWKGETDINSASIGIEIVNPGNLEDYPPFKDAQIDAVIRLCRDICERYTIKPENILAHSDIAPSRKTDPGHNFPGSGSTRRVSATISSRRRSAAGGFWHVAKTASRSRRCNPCWHFMATKSPSLVSSMKAPRL